MNTIKILYGLPCCGKTTYAESQRKIHRTHIVSINDWKWKSDSSGLSYLLTELTTTIDSKRKKTNPSRRETIIVDGPFLKHEDLLSVSGKIFRSFPDWDLQVVIWENHRDRCVANAKESLQSHQTPDGWNHDLMIKLEQINKSKIEEITLSYGSRNASAIFKHVTYMPVVTKNMIDLFSLCLNWEDYKVEDESEYLGITKVNYFLEGKEYSMGGSSSSYNDQNYIIPPEDMPEDFLELDELLEKIFPNVTVLQYKKIRRTAISKQIRSTNDYYGGNEKYVRYVCDLPKLFDIVNNISQKAL